MALDLGIPAGLGLGSLDFQNKDPNPDVPIFIHSLTENALRTYLVTDPALGTGGE